MHRRIVRRRSGPLSRSFLPQAAGVVRTSHLDTPRRARRWHRHGSSRSEINSFATRCPRGTPSSPYSCTLSCRTCRTRLMPRRMRCALRAPRSPRTACSSHAHAYCTSHAANGRRRGRRHTPAGTIHRRVAWHSRAPKLFAAAEPVRYFLPNSSGVKFCRSQSSNGVRSQLP